MCLVQARGNRTRNLVPVYLIRLAKRGDFEDRAFRPQTGSDRNVQACRQRVRLPKPVAPLGLLGFLRMPMDERPHPVRVLGLTFVLLDELLKDEVEIGPVLHNRE